jgi:hypothetical protein
VITGLKLVQLHKASGPSDTDMVRHEVGLKDITNVPSTTDAAGKPCNEARLTAACGDIAPAPKLLAPQGCTVRDVLVKSTQEVAVRGFFARLSRLITRGQWTKPSNVGIYHRFFTTCDTDATKPWLSWSRITTSPYEGTEDAKHAVVAPYLWLQRRFIAPPLPLLDEPHKSMCGDECALATDPKAGNKAPFRLPK